MRGEVTRETRGLVRESLQMQTNQQQEIRNVTASNNFNQGGSHSHYISHFQLIQDGGYI